MVEVLILGATPEEPPPDLPTEHPGARFRFASTEAELRALLPETEVMFHWHQRTAWLHAAWPDARRLRWIQATGVGMERFLFPELVAGDVVLTNCRGVFDGTIAEYVTGLMLLMAKDFAGTLEAQREHRWHYRKVEGLERQRIVILGAGTIGRAIARAARAFAMSVTGVARTARTGDGDFDSIRSAAELADAVAAADWLVIAAPLTDATRGLVDAAVLARLPRTARLVNIGRGPIVDEDALIAALRAGRLGGAALDVFATEPLPPDHPLWGLPNVIVSPHMASDVLGYEAWYTAVFLDNLECWLAGRPLRNVVDKRLGFVPSDPGGAAA